MKQIISIFILSIAIAFSSTSLNAQVTRSANQAITATDVTTLNLDLKSEAVEIKETKGSRVIIESHITLESINNTTLLEFLIKSGRYNLDNTLDPTAGILTVSRKTSGNVLLVKGQECRESVRYVILVPESIKKINKNSGTGNIN